MPDSVASARTETPAPAEGWEGADGEGADTDDASPESLQLAYPSARMTNIPGPAIFHQGARATPIDGLRDMLMSSPL